MLLLLLLVCVVTVFIFSNVNLPENLILKSLYSDTDNMPSSLFPKLLLLLLPERVIGLLVIVLASFLIISFSFSLSTLPPPANASSKNYSDATIPLVLLINF